MLRTLLALSIASLLVCVLGACDEDEDKKIVSFDLTIVNNDEVEYEVWIDAGVDTEGYVQDGVVGASATRVLKNLTISVTYDICLAVTNPSPNPPTQCEYQQVITSNGPDITWEVPPPAPARADDAAH